MSTQYDKENLILSTLQDWFENIPKEPFVPGKTYIKVAQANENYSDFAAMFQAIFDRRWVEGGRWTEKAQDSLCDITGQDHVSFVNSGSSANLVAFLALQERFGSHKVITTAVGFPTTITAPLQAGKEIIFIDTDPETLAPNWDQLSEAYMMGKDVPGVILAHTLGFPFDEEEVVLRASGSWFLADACDCLGGKFREYPVGILANLSTYSFYPAHHVSGIEMGAVCSQSKELTRIVESYRNWGKNCHCKPNEDNACGARFNGKWGEMPVGFDHKYIYSRLGYNLKTTEIQTALLYSQLQHIDEIQSGRLANFIYLKEQLSDLSEYFGFMSYNPKISTPSPFGFFLLCKPPINRLKLIRYLENHKIGTRLVFGGNLSLQPGFQPYVRSGQIQTPYPLEGANNITANAFWISCNQNLTPEMMNYMIEILHKSVKEIK